MKQIIGTAIVKEIKFPKPATHKGDNGRLLIIAGSKKYHGSLLYALKVASRIVDLIYVLTTRENQKLIEKLKEKTAEFIPVNLPLLVRRGRGGHRGCGDYDPLFISSSRGGDIRPDCILIGPGMGVSKRTYNLVKKVLKSGIRAVLDADALNVLDAKLKRLLNQNYILTPHAGEFKKVFKLTPNVENVRKMVKKYSCTIVLKGRVDILGNPVSGIRYNVTGNQGMTKGGTGDVLAGLIAAFFTKNDAFISAAAGVFINGKAGDELYKRVGPFYSAEDLVEQIPKTLWYIIKKQ